MEYSLVCPFLTDDPEFARGVEFGMLYMKMNNKDEIKDYFQLKNQEQILLLLNRMGWQITKLGKAWRKCWFYLEASCKSGE